MKFAIEKYFLILILALFYANTGFGQKESAIWYFGEFAGLDFNSGVPVPLTNGQLNTKEGCATISDANGSLLFYSDGVTVWNRQHQVMPNGTNLLGHSSSTESAIIIPKPGESSIYYIFTVDKPSYFLTAGNPISGISYSKVDMNLNNGLGDIDSNEKNIHLVTYDINNTLQSEYKCSEKITAVTHGNGSEIWVITQFMNNFYSFLITANGVNTSPVISSVQQNISPVINEEGQNISAIGYLKVSPNGKKIAIAHSSTILGSPSTGHRRSGKVLLYDFDNSTGIVSNQKTLLTGEYPYGVEFSPNSKLLYATSGIFNTDDTFINSNLYQYTLESTDIEASQTTISNSQNVAGALQLAIDGKIYRSGYPAFGNGSHLSVINNPNELNSNCNYNHNSIYLNGKLAYLGLPPFIQSIFNYTFDYEFTCLGDNTHFFITSDEPYDTLVWDFGDGTTSNIEDTYHTYSNPGNYTVSLTLTLNSVEYDPFIKQIIISEPPQVMQDTYDLIQCDSFDNNPNDGISTFNLKDANGPITFYSTDNINVFYYNNLQDAIDDENNTEALNYIYTNFTQNEVLYAKVTTSNTNCYSIATIRLITTQSIDIGTYELHDCDYENVGTAEFNFQETRNQIISDLNLSNQANISFHLTEEHAAIGINPIDDNYNTSNTILYIRVEDNNNCYGNGLLELNVTSFPILEDQNLEICQSDFPIIIDSGLDASIKNNYNYLWSSNETTEQINIYETGIYELFVIDPVYNCENNLTVTVVENELPELQEIIIENLNVTVLLNNENIHEFEFALDNENSNYQQSNTFINIEPGFHTVYIRDVFMCNTISAEFNIIGFPPFFTPNNDGINDFWNIKGLRPTDFPNAQILIFDRYGKLLKAFNPHQSNGWNGTFNGNLMTPNDYWYYLKLPTGIEYRGHFSLKV